MTSFRLRVGFKESGSSFRSFWKEVAFNLLGDGARRGFEDFGVSVGRTAGFGFGFEGVGGVEVGLGMEDVTGVLALGRGMESEDITRGRGLLESMVDGGQVVGGEVLPENDGPGIAIEAIAACICQSPRVCPRCTSKFQGIHYLL